MKFQMQISCILYGYLNMNEKHLFLTLPPKNIHHAGQHKNALFCMEERKNNIQNYELAE